MANDSYNETVNAVEKEKKTKQLANMISVQEGISYEKAYQRAKIYLASGIERPYLGKMHSNLNELINNSCYSPDEEKTPRKIKGNVKRGSSSKEYLKKAFVTGLMVAVIAGSAVMGSKVIDTIDNSKAIEDYENQIRTEYNLGYHTSFVSKNSRMSYSSDKEHFVITDYDLAAREIYESLKGENDEELDPILYNEFRAFSTLGNMGDWSEKDQIDRQIDGMNNLLYSYRNLDNNDEILDYDNFYTYALRVVEKNYGLDKDTIDTIKDSMVVTKNIYSDGKIIEKPYIGNIDHLNMLLDAYNEIGIKMEKASLSSGRSK